MGFHAASAEDVYRYALRLDDPDRLLTDRFGLSIVFVNDRSEACEEFLSRYFVDICHLTAHRIRFIFFANLLQDNVTQAASRGVVRGIFDLWRKRKTPSAYSSTQGYASWSDTQPSALAPMERPENFFPSTGSKRDQYSAVLGSREGWEFAQRLGIGQHVPCFVVFTDVGSKQFHLLPVHAMSPEEMYRHVSGWINDYYEQNRATLQRWEYIENEALTWSKQVKSSLRSVEAWRNRGRAVWQQLASVCQAKERIEHAFAGTEADWQQLYREFRFSYAVQPHLDACEKALAQLRQRNEYRSRLGKHIHLLEEAKEADAIWNEINLLSSACADILTPSCKLTLEAAVNEIKACHSQFNGLPETLADWVNDSLFRRPSLKKFKRAWRTWTFVSHSGSASLGEEYQFTLEWLYRFTLSSDADQHAADTLDALAQHLEMDSHSSEWQAETAAYRAYLCDYLHQVQTSAPPWLVQRAPDVTLNAIFASNAQSQAVFQNEHPLYAALQAELLLQQQSLQWQQQYEETVKRCASTMQAALRDVQAQYADEAPQERALIYAQLLAQIGRKRNALEAECYAQSKKAFPDISPLSAGQAAHLHHVLDEYQSVVQRIVYPHHYDPLIRTLETDFAVVEQVIEKNSALPQSAVTSEENRRTEHKVAEALNGNEALKQTIELNVNAPPQWTPAAQLAKCLLVTFQSNQARSRLESFLPDNLRGNFEYRVREALLPDHVNNFLNELEDQELDDMLQTLDRLNIGTDKLPLPRLHEGKIERLLNRVGANTRAPLMGQEAMLRFLADLTPETIAAMPIEDVRRSGEELRRKLEQYAKQFLMLYGPLALEEDKQSNLRGETLGNLSALMISTLKKMDSGALLLQGDERRERIVEKIQTVNKQRTWLKSIIKACEDMISRQGNYPGPANAFSHDNGLPTNELKECLLRLADCTRIVVKALQQAEIYPICLHFASMQPDSMYGCRFEFDSDPSGDHREVVAFSDFPPSLFGAANNFLMNLSRRTLLMFPLSNPERIDPLLAFSTYG